MKSFFYMALVLQAAILILLLPILSSKLSSSQSNIPSNHTPPELLGLTLDQTLEQSKQSCLQSGGVWLPAPNSITDGLYTCQSSNPRQRVFVGFIDNRSAIVSARFESVEDYRTTAAGVFHKLTKNCRITSSPNDVEGGMTKVVNCKTYEIKLADFSNSCENVSCTIDYKIKVNK